MKDNFEKNIRRAAREITLTDGEREKMRFVLSEYAAMKPVREPLTRPREARGVFLNALLAYARRPAGIAMAAVLILAASSGGIAYAAEGALPGDALYPIKTAVVEPLRVALAMSPEAKAALQMSFAEHRVDEAATLASEGRLSTSTEAELAANFNENAVSAVAVVAHERTQDPTTADLLATKFAARLAAYQNVLAAVSGRARDSESTTHIQTAIQAQLSSIEVDQGDTASTSPRGARSRDQGDVANQDARHLQDAADAALRISTDIVGTASSTLDASSSASALDELSRASELAKQGSALLEEHDEAGASRAFQDSLSATARLDVLTRASEKFKIQAFAATSTTATSSDESSGRSYENRGGHSRDSRTPNSDGQEQSLPFGL